MGQQKWSRETLIREIKRLHDEGKELFPSSPEMKKLVSASTIHFGSWRAAVVEAGFDYDRIILRSREKKRRKQQGMAMARFLERMKELDGFGESLDEAHVKRNFPELHTFALREDTFGSWERALQAAHIERVHPPKSTGTSARLGKNWFRKLVIERFQEKGAEIPSAETLEKEYPSLLPVLEKLFGGPHEFIKALKSAPR